MNKSRILIFVFGLCAVVLIGGMIALASISVAPHTQTVETTIPDDKIPR